MKTKVLFIIAIMSIFFANCVQQSDYDKIKTENEELKTEQKKLETENKKLEEKKKEATMHDEAEALKLLKDHYDFYNANFIYRKPKVRKVNYNTFKISLEECPNKPEYKYNDFFWSSRVYTLTINDDGTYVMK